MFNSVNVTGEPSIIERRNQKRQRTLLHGKLLFVTSSLSGDCTIRNLSLSGAKITTPSSELPDDPILVITKTGMAHEAEKIWSRNGEIGVQFVTTHDLSETVPTRLFHAYRLWVEALPR